MKVSFFCREWARLRRPFDKTTRTLRLRTQMRADALLVDGPHDDGE
jgi:hypothetical protein